MRKCYFLIFCSFGLFLNIQAQTYNWKCLQGDTVEIFMPAITGSISWQYSYDTLTWNDIPGYDYSPLVQVVNYSPTGRKYFRGVVHNGTCINYTYPVKINLTSSTLGVVNGDFFHGGIVFNTDGSGDGLISTTNDQSGSVAWGSGLIYCSATYDNRGDSNTVIIVNANTMRPIAASVCDSLNLNNQSDWYLPARNELNLLYTNRMLVGVFPADYYWSSTEANAPNAYFRRFGINYTDYSSKSTTMGCRCTRRYYIVEPFAKLTITAAMNPDPGTPVITLQPQSSDICEGQSAILSVEAQDAFFQWQKDGLDITGETSDTLSINNFNSADEGTYRCKVYRCLNETFSNNAVLTKLDLPIVTVSNDTAICNGSSAQISASGGVNYSWTPSSSLSNPFVSNPIAIPTQSTNYIVAAEAPNGCSDTASVFVFVQKPYEDEEICLITVDSITGKNKVIWQKTPGVGTAVYNVYREVTTNIYNWVGSVPYDDPSEFTDISSAPETQCYKYKISLTDTCGAESNKSFYHQTVNLSISQGVPSSTIVLQWNPYADQSGLYTPAEYIIYRGTSPSAMSYYTSVSGSVYSYNDVNVLSLYYYKIAFEKTCGLFIRSCSNIQDNSSIVGITAPAIFSDVIIISPNPMSASATLTIPNFSYQLSVIGDLLTVTDITGKVVRRVSDAEAGNFQIEKSSNFQIKIERGNLKSGIYFVELNAGRIFRGKLVVE